MNIAAAIIGHFEDYIKARCPMLTAGRLLGGDSTYAQRMLVYGATKTVAGVTAYSYQYMLYGYHPDEYCIVIPTTDPDGFELVERELQRLNDAQ